MPATTNNEVTTGQGDDGIDPRAEFLQTLLTKRGEAIAGRSGSGIETEWTEDEEHYQGIDDANRAFQTANQLHRSKNIGVTPLAKQGATRSKVFLNITRPYVDAASARVSDMLLPTDDRSWEIKATPIPRLSEAQLSTLAQAMRLADAMQAQQALEEQAEQAAQAAKKMQTAIEDPLVESNWHGEVRQVIEDSARIGSGVLKGPFPVQRTVRLTKRNPTTGMVEYFKGRGFNCC